MDFDTQLKDALKKGAEQGLNDSQLKQLSDKMISDFNSQGGGMKKNESSGIIQSVAQDITKAPLKMLTTAAQVGRGVIDLGATLAGDKQLSQNIQSDIRRVNTQGSDYGYFGTVKPLGQTGSAGGDLIDIAATAARTASLLAPIGEATGATTFLGKTAQLLKNAAPFAVTSGGAGALEQLGKGEGPVKSAVSGLEEAAGGVIGLGLLNGGSSAMRTIGGKMMKNSVIKSIGEKLTNMADSLISGGQNSLDQIAQRMSWTSKAWQQEFDGLHKQLVDEAGNLFKADVPNGDAIYSDLKDKFQQYVNKIYEKKRTDFSDVFNDPITIGKFDDTLASLVDAKGFIKRIGEKVDNFDIGKTLEDYVRQIQNSLGIENGKITKQPTLEMVSNLKQIADGLVGATDDETKRIQNIGNKLMDDTTKYIKEKNPNLLSRWKAARDQAESISQNLRSDFADKFKSAGSINDFVDQIVNGGSKLTRGQIKAFTNVFDDKEKAVISQLIYNNLIDIAKSETPQAGAKIIDTALENLSKKGGDSIILPGHGAALENLSNLMKSNFDDFINNIKSVRGPATEETISKAREIASQAQNLNLTDKIVNIAKEGRSSELADAISKIRGKEEMQSVMGLLENAPELKKEVWKNVLRGIINDNSAAFAQVTKQNAKSPLDVGKYDFRGILEQLDNIGSGKGNREEIMNMIPEDFKASVNDLFDLASQRKGLVDSQGHTLLRAAHGLAALFQGLASNPSAVYHASRVISLTKDNINKMSSEEIIKNLNKLSQELVDIGAESTKDNWTKIGEALIKGSEMASSKPAKKAAAIIGGDTTQNK